MFRAQPQNASNPKLVPNAFTYAFIGLMLGSVLARQQPEGETFAKLVIMFGLAVIGGVVGGCCDLVDDFSTRKPK